MDSAILHFFADELEKLSSSFASPSRIAAAIKKKRASGTLTQARLDRLAGIAKGRYAKRVASDAPQEQIDEALRSRRVIRFAGGTSRADGSL